MHDDTHDITDTIDLRHYVDLAALRAEDEDCTGLLAASPWIKQPHTRPFRIVIADKEDKFVVWDEIMDTDHLPEEKSDRKSHFVNGDYFWPHELHKAYARWAERVTNMIPTIASVYRMLEI